MTTILFIVSLCVLFTMIASKVFEIKIRKIHFLSNIFAKGDQIIHNFLGEVNFKYNRYKKISKIFVFEFLPSYLYEILVRMKDYVAKKYYSAGDEFRGRRVLRTNGSVSFFLERLGEDRRDTSQPRV